MFQKKLLQSVSVVCLCYSLFSATPLHALIRKTTVWGSPSTISTSSLKKEATESLGNKSRRLVVESKVGYFVFTSPKVNKFYKRGGLDVQLSASFPFSFRTREWSLGVYGSVEYLQKSGHSKNSCLQPPSNGASLSCFPGNDQKISLRGLPLSLGLQLALPLPVRTYFTIGPRYFFIQTRQYYPYVKGTNYSHGFGGFVNAGLLCTIFRRLTLDPFVEYSYGVLRFSSSRQGTKGHSINVGGFCVGGGIGYVF